MLPLAHRLRHTAEVALVRQHGRQLRHPLVMLIVYANLDDRGGEDQPASRFAFVAGKKVGPAVQRNRVKRRLREIVRHRLGQIQPGRDCLLIARPAAVTATFAELEHVVVQLLTRADVLTLE